MDESFRPTLEEDPVPTTAKPPFPLRRLKNLGNTCYMNTVLQALFAVPEFMLRLKGKGGKITKCLFGLFHVLYDESFDKVGNPTEVKKAIDAKTELFRGSGQKDAHEFLTYLLDSIQMELEKEWKSSHPNENPNAMPLFATDEYFRVVLREKVVCDTCGHCSR